MGSKRDAGRGLTDKKICLAVTIGIVFGVIFFLYNSKGGHGATYKEEVVNKISKEDFDKIVSEKEALEKELSTVKAELKNKIEANGNSRSEVKAGPLGTVKSERTNPLVTPDRSVNPELAELLDKVAINNELIVAISNNYIRGMLQTWFESIQRVGIKNFLVIALDDEVAEFCKSHDVPVYRRDPKISDAQKGTGDNHAISGLKFHFLREFLVLGYNVLLSDVDIVYLQNPFDHIYRDSDVESMTDGFNNQTSYGYDDVTDDPSMGWARYAHTMRIFVFNSGLFYIRATVPSIELLDRVTTRLSKEDAWDQAVFNEELFYPSHPGYVGLHASTRVMDYYNFLNSKVLFKEVRKEARFANHKPVTIHVNYHPEKHPRMLAIVEYYVNGNKEALDRFPDGSM